MSSTPGYSKRYDLDRAQGIDRSPVPAGPVRDHIRTLLAEGLTWSGIGRAAGISRTGVRNIATGQAATVRRPVAARILRTTTRTAAAAVTNPLDEVPARGSIRRVQSLLALGHRHTDIIAASGVTASMRLTGNPPVSRVTKGVAEAIDVAFRALCMRPGTSPRTRARAARSGYVPPLAWDDIDLDVVPAVPVEKVTVADEAEWLARAGQDFETVATRLGYKDGRSLERTLYRAGRYDLVTQLRRAA